MELAKNSKIYLDTNLFIYFFENNPEYANKNIKDYIPNLKLVTTSKEILICASKIRAEYNYRSPDSIHLATAKIEQCEYFYGADKHLKSFKDIKIVII